MHHYTDTVKLMLQNNCTHPLINPNSLTRTFIKSKKTKNSLTYVLGKAIFHIFIKDKVYLASKAAKAIEFNFVSTSSPREESTLGTIVPISTLPCFDLQILVLVL